MMIPTRLRILVLRSGAVGDFIVTVPVFQAFRSHWPGCHIAVAAHSEIAATALAAGLIDEVRSIDSADFSRLYASPAGATDEFAAYMAGFGTILSFLHDPDGAAAQNIKALSCGTVIIHSPLVRDTHAVDHFLSPLKQLGIPTEHFTTPCLRLPRNSVLEGGEAPGMSAERSCVIHPGSGSPTKNWPLDRFVELAGRIRSELALEPVFTLGEADSALAGALELLKPSFPVVSNRPLLDIARILAASRAYVGNDSGISHLAAALGLPTVAIFGPSRHELWAPRGRNVSVVKSQDFSPDGIQEVPVGVVFAACRERWSSS